MGLDMSLYRVCKPVNIKEGEVISFVDRFVNRKYNGVIFENTDVTCDAVTNNAVKCVVEIQEWDPRAVLKDTLLGIGMSEKMANYFAGKFEYSGSSVIETDSEYTFKVTDPGINAVFSEIAKTTKILETTDCFNVSCTIDDGVATITFKQTSKFFDNNGYYQGKYNKPPVYEDKYALVLSEQAYQRNGLNEIGRGLLPENCDYCDDKELIEQLVDEGDLDAAFIECWEDGKSVFIPWW